jgi:hypothetical protein
VDTLWHAAIIDTHFYADLLKALRFLLHYRPSGACSKESRKRQISLKTMKALYATFFNGIPLEFINIVEQAPSSTVGSTISLRIMSLTGWTTNITMPGTKLVDDLKSRLQDRTGQPPNQQKLMHVFEELLDDRTLSSYKLTDGAVVNMLKTLRGC